MALRARKVSGAFEKRPPGAILPGASRRMFAQRLPLQEPVRRLGALQMNLSKTTIKFLDIFTFCHFWLIGSADNNMHSANCLHAM